MLTGNNLIGYHLSGESNVKFSRDIKIGGQSTRTDFYEASTGEVDQAVQKASKAFLQFRLLAGKEKAGFLLKIVAGIEEAKEKLVQLAMQETHLPEGRLNGELQRTTNQIKLFAQLLTNGSWVNAIIDTALPERKPLPKPDIRQMQIALGVVGVFGASNFPFAFSVAGGDTAAALAAGCPVVYKAHPGHPATSERVGMIINQTAKEIGLPDGVFSLLQGETHHVGQALVAHPLVSAIAFTGSFYGGKAIFDAAAKRKEPIPVYAEMGSVNPVFILPDMLAIKGLELAEALAASNLLGTGQFCTNPGILIQLESEQEDSFISQFSDRIKNDNCGCMLTGSIYQGYTRGIQKLSSFSGVELVASGKESNEQHAATPYVYKTTGANFLQHTELMEEVFGPSSIHVTAGDKNELLAIAQHLTGQLTVSIWATEKDLEAYSDLVRILELKAGRIIYNAVPTGVEVTGAMVHGGPFPATTDSKATSVGTNAIYRFTRPVCYQGAPQKHLPQELWNENPLGIWRTVNGEPTNAAINQ